MKTDEQRDENSGRRLWETVTGSAISCRDWWWGSFWVTNVGNMLNNEIRSDVRSTPDSP